MRIDNRNGAHSWARRYLWSAAILAAIVVLAACQPIQAPDAGEAPATQQAEAEPGAALPQGDADAGTLVLAAAVGCGCHFNGDLGGLAGGNAFEGDFGAVYARNLTPDAATGIGDLTDQQLADAIRVGKGADGRNLFIMPRYSGMADQDVADLIAYLRSQEPVENDVPVRELAFEPPAFEMTEAPPAVAPTEPADRGRYLATLAMCTRCHTPANEDGSSKYGPIPGGRTVPRTVAAQPNSRSGLGSWSVDRGRACRFSGAQVSIQTAARRAPP